MGRDDLELLYFWVTECFFCFDLKNHVGSPQAGDLVSPTAR